MLQIKIEIVEESIAAPVSEAKEGAKICIPPAAAQVRPGSSSDVAFKIRNYIFAFAIRELPREV